MLAQPLPSPDLGRLTLTEAALASADRLWRTEMRRIYGPEAVLTYGYTPEGQGGLGTPLRRSYEARRVAVALWRQERRSAAIRETMMAETDKPEGESVAPPTVPIRGINQPDPTTRSEPEGKDPVKDAERKPDDPDKAAKDGLA